MVPKYYEFQNQTKILSGEFALENIPTELDFYQAKRPLILSDKVLEKIGSVQTVIDAIGEYIEITDIYTEIPQDSDMDIINMLALKYKNLRCDSIIAIGGGSVIDTAKGLRMVVSQNVTNLEELVGAENIHYKTHIPFIAIPTTAGTGSEVTLVAVILNRMKKIKMEYISYFLLPDVAILDSRMTQSLPPKATASTGMDALCHGIESYSCMQKNPMSDAYATAAIELIRDNLIQAVEKGKDKKVRLAMANASLMAGVAFSNSMVGLVHAIGHSLGAISHVPHGDAMAILLPAVMEYNLDVLKEEYAKLYFYFVGEEEYIKMPKEKRAEAMIYEVKKLREVLHEKTGLPITLKQANVKKDNFQEIAKKAINDGAIIVNPKDAKEEDIIRILEKAYDA
ncbi:MAG: iron-containing alcohol dehydrogenase [Clostridia bacterium]